MDPILSLLLFYGVFMCEGFEVGKERNVVKLMPFNLESAEKIIYHWTPVWYNEISYVTCKVFLAIRPHSMFFNRPKQNL